MILKKSFKFRLEPTKREESLFSQFAGAKRWIFNLGLAQRKETWEKEKKKISLYDQNNELVALKEKYKWLKDIHSQVLQQALGDLNVAFLKFFQGSGYPHFKCKGVRDSFRYPQGVKIKENRVWLPKIGFVKFRKSREIQGKIKQTTIVLEANRWYISFSCEVEKDMPKVTMDPKKTVGIDLGIKSFAVMAIGEENRLVTIENPKYLRKALKKLQFLSRNLSSKKKGSKNRNRSRKKLSKMHFRIKNLRLDFFHKLALTIVKSHDIISVEKMNVKKMLQGLRTLARAISDAGWGIFLNCLKNKAEEWGKTLYEVSSLLGSTQQCSNCGRKQTMNLSQREYVCECGQKMDRDWNAAINIRKAAGATV